MPRVQLLVSALVGALVVSVLQGCAVCKDYWSFPLTRMAYSGVDPTKGPVGDPAESGGDEIVWAAFLLLPIAFDIVVIPITDPRDLIVKGRL